MTLRELIVALQSFEHDHGDDVVTIQTDDAYQAYVAIGNNGTPYLTTYNPDENL